MLYVHDFVKSFIDGGCHCIWSSLKMSFNIREGGTSYCLIIKYHYIDRITSMTISGVRWRIPFETLIGKSRNPQNKISIWRASPDIPYKLWGNNATCCWKWQIAMIHIAYQKYPRLTLIYMSLSKRVVEFLLVETWKKRWDTSPRCMHMFYVFRKYYLL